MTDFDRGYYWVRTVDCHEWIMISIIRLHEGWRFFYFGDERGYHLEDIVEWGDRIERKAKEALGDGTR